MLIISQNASNYAIPIPDGTIYRINLAWVNSLKELENLLKKHIKQKIFLDLPIKRVKPPNNKYSLEDLIPLMNSFKNIKYFAVSNVNSSKDLTKYLKLVPREVVIVPKIENPKGILNIKEIVETLQNKEKVIMLDHDDLYSSIIKLKEPTSKFTYYIKKLNEFCNENNVILLRTIGVIFGDVEKRSTSYVK